MFVTLEAKSTNQGNYYYYWSTGDTTKSVEVSYSDTFKVYMVDEYGACSDSAWIYSDFCSCCDTSCMLASRIPDTIYGGNPVEWIDTFLILDHDLYIRDNALLKIKNSTIVVRKCAKIIVENFNSSALPGRLYIDSSVIGICQWQGIEVWGTHDACPEAPNAHGRLRITNSILTNADIGIFVGKRDNNGTHDREYAGGIISLDNDTFRNNYVDVMFSEWSFAGICQDGCQDGGIWQDTIQNCFLDTLASTYFCNDFVDSTLSYYESFYQPPPPPCDPPISNWRPPTNPPIPVRCHIIDLSPYVDVWIAQLPYLCPNLVCEKSYWLSGNLGGSILQNNQYMGDGNNPPCYSNPPHDKYR